MTFVGVPQTIHLGFGQGEIAHQRCNVYMIEQYCTGFNTCPLGGGIAETVFRAAITTDLLWFSEDGFEFAPRTVYLIGNDQGGQLVINIPGYLNLQDEFFYGRHLEFDFYPEYKPENLVRTGRLYSTLLGGVNTYEAGWDGWTYCTPAKRASGDCGRAFLPYYVLPYAPALQGFFHFAGCSQLGYLNETNPATSCNAAMHLGNGANAFWLGTRTQAEWEATEAFRNITRDFAYYLNRSDVNPTHSTAFTHFGLSIFYPVEEPTPEEYAFHSRFTSLGDGLDLDRKKVWSNYPRGLGFEDVFASNPNDQWSVAIVDINKEAGRAPTPIRENVAQTFAIYASSVGAAQLAHKNEADAPVHRFYLTAGLGDTSCGTDTLTIKGQPTVPGGVCGHGLIGQLGNLNPASGNPSDRVTDLGSVDASRLMPHSCGHQSMRSCDVFVTQVAQIERDHAKHYLQ